MKLEAMVGADGKVLLDAARLLEAAARKLKTAAVMFDENGRPSRSMAATIKRESLSQARAEIDAARARIPED